MRVLVTGVGGFVGPHAAAALLEDGHEVHGVVRAEPPPDRVPAEVRLHPADLLDDGAADRVVAAVRPDGVLHLAGFSVPARADGAIEAAYRANLGGTLAILGAVRREAPGARLVVVTSSEVYGAVAPDEIPVTEATPMRPVGVYGASKAAAEIAAGQWERAYRLDVLRVRPFNHTGAGQRAEFVCSALARQVARIEAGLQEPVLRVGNLDPVRDFADVRDVAAGYVALLARGRSGEVYNLCTGEGVSIAEVIALLRAITPVPMRAHSDPHLRRPVDVPRLVGSRERISRDTGWAPRHALAETLAWVVEDWRRRVARGE